MSIILLLIALADTPQQNPEAAQPTFIDSVFSGVIGGLIATLIVVATRVFWIKIVGPWIEEWAYRDAHIEGKWKSQHTLDGVVRDGIIEIERKGHIVFGTSTVLTGPLKGKRFKFRGTFHNLIFTATYSTTDKAALDRGTVTFMLVGNGTRLEGFMAYYSDDKHCVEAVSYQCTRDYGEGSSEIASSASSRLPVSESPG